MKPSNTKLLMGALAAVAVAAISYFWLITPSSLPESSQALNERRVCAYGAWLLEHIKDRKTENWEKVARGYEMLRDEGYEPADNCPIKQKLSKK
ncbi:hypothetical protein D6779_04475 [Candidatus Parcubacteria bacterium]|nr:MAG: hypothetical protein D6779_04475 [Candidatus Parcubacteria bacterium]